jgi:hypothetical protein
VLRWLGDPGCCARATYAEITVGFGIVVAIVVFLLIIIITFVVHLIVIAHLVVANIIARLRLGVR